MPVHRSSICVALLASAFVLAVGCGDDEESGVGGKGASSTTGAGGSGGGATDGVQIPGLTAAVKATYDEHGILHLACSTDEDCFASLGYFHAANRFFFMDFVRNLVRGRLGALVKGGSTVLSQDYANRQWFSTPEGEPLEDALYAQASPEVRGYMDAYSRGVNAWIGDMRAGENGATLTTEYDFLLIVKSAIRDWEPADSTAVGLYVLDDLSNNSASEIGMAAVLPAFDPALAVDLFSPRPVFDAFTLPSAQSSQPSGILPLPGGLAANRQLFEGAYDALRRVGSGSHAARPGEVGSNNWVVSGGRTAAKHALLANDPHLPLTNPSIWFPVEIDAVSEGTGDYHVAGSTFPGLPALMVGHNESIAWGVTTAYYDLADVYVEDLSPDGSAVTWKGAEVPIIAKEVSFADSATGDTVTKTLRWVPHHGPIVSEDAAAGTAVTIRWRGHDGGTDLDAFFALGRARTVEEAREGIELASCASQNFVVADVQGDIGWFPYSKLPVRPWASAALAPWLPLPGDGSAEWAGEVPLAELPQAENPASGVIATANQDLTGASADGDILNDGQAALQAYGKADGTREQRILDLLAAGGDAHTVETMSAIQGDDHSLYGTFVVPAVLAATAGQALSTDEQAVVDALAAWAFTCPTGLDGPDPILAADAPDALAASESVGCSAFHATLFAIVAAALDDEITKAAVDLGGERWALLLVARALRDPSSIASGDLLWDDVSTAGVVETRDDTLLKGVKLAATSLALNGAPNAWRWGRLHAISLRSIFDNFGITTYNVAPLAAPGGLFTVNVANPRSSALPAAGAGWDFGFTSGPSVRFVVEMRDDGPRMTYQLPGGSDLHRESPFYNNLLPAWLANEAIDFPFGPGAVPSPAVAVDVAPAP